jgi:hypothetical protein
MAIDGDTADASALVQPYDGPMHHQVETPRGELIEVDA